MPSRCPAIVSAPLASGAIAGSSPLPKSPVWRSLPFIGGPAFPICADRARRIVSGSVRIARLRPRSRIIGATTSPRQPSSARYEVAPPQANAGCVDCLLSKRAESFSLKRRLAVADLGAREKGLEAIVRRPGEDHPAQDLAAFVRRERLNENGAPKTSVACFDDLVYRRGVSTLRRDTPGVVSSAGDRSRMSSRRRSSWAKGSRRASIAALSSGVRPATASIASATGTIANGYRSITNVRSFRASCEAAGAAAAGGHQPDATATDGESAPGGLPDELLDLRRRTGACRPRDLFAAGEDRHGRDRADSVRGLRVRGARPC